MPSTFCRSNPQRSLANHIKYVHPLLDVGAHRVYLAKCARITKPAVLTKLLKGKSTLDQVYSLPYPDWSKIGGGGGTYLYSNVTGGKAGNEGFPRFSLDTVQMKGFLKFLVSIDGQMCNQNVATEMAVNVSKFFKLAGG